MLKLLKGHLQWQFCILPALVCMLTLSAYAQNKPGVTLRQKLAPGVQALSSNAAPHTVRVHVKHKASFLKWMSEQQVQTVITPVTGDDNILVLSDLNDISWQKLLQNPWAEFIDRTNRIAKEELELRDADFTVNKINALHSRYLQLNGEGLAVSVKEGAFDPNDIDLKGRVLTPEKNGSSHTFHATTMATLIAGGGNSGPNGKGVAYRAKLAYSDFAELMPDNSSELLAKGISVQNHSYGVGLENYYGIESAAYDKQVYENPQLLHVFSSGNSGDKTAATGNYANIQGVANLTGQFKTSKNTLSVGALDPGGEVGRLSSRGPAHDGRVKPELVAHGIGGTSEAAAVVSGIALLVQQAYTSLYNTLPPASLVKAALINSADDTGRPAVDFESGFGNVNALGAVRAIQQQNFYTNSVSKSEEKKYILDVTSGAGLLKVTLVWHESAAPPGAQTALINDLDLTLRNTVTGETWRPWILNSYPHPDSLKLPAKRGIDRINNVEQITLATPAAGSYEVIVTGFTVAQTSQDFSLVYEVSTGTEWLYPAANSTLLATKPYTVNWQTNQVAGTARLEYKYSSDQSWVLIKEAVDLSKKTFSWITPDTSAVMQLRLVTEAGVTESEEFVVSKLLRLKVGFICDDQVMVHWTGMRNAQEYQLYHMGDSYLEALLSTSDTLAVISRSTFQNLSNYIAVAPVIQNRAGLSSTTIATDQVGVSCYIKNFLPSQFVLSRLDLQLELSTLYDLATITLERKVKNEYLGVSTITPTQLKYELNDPAPLPGKNTYRVKLITKTGKVYYSHSEDIIYANNKYIQAYPNPVTGGEPLYIVIASASAQIQLFDRTGRLMYESEEGSVIKSIPTDNLPKGLYILRTLTEEGAFLSTRVVIL